MSTVPAPTCGVSDALAMRANQTLCQWPRGHVVTWGLVSTLPNWQRSSMLDVFERSFAMWSLACGVLFEYSDQGAQANIPITTAALPRNVLADAMLPCGPVTQRTQLPQRFSTQIDYRNAENPPQGSIALFPVAGHETGHSVGLGHNTNPNETALLDPVYNVRIQSLQPWDVMEAVRRYGEFVPPPDPDRPIDVEAAESLAKLLDVLAHELRHNKDLRDAVGRVWSS